MEAHRIRLQFYERENQHVCGDDLEVMIGGYPQDPKVLNMSAMRFSINILKRSRTFQIVMAFFIAANGWSWVRHRFSPECCDQEMTIGFPVPFHISGGIAGLSQFYLLGLLLDAAIALTIAVLMTWIVRLFHR